MRTPLTAARAATAALVSLLSLSLVAAEFKLPETDATPAELVTAALQSELEGPNEVRKQLLDRALKLDPDYAPARWQAGFVRNDEEWITLSEVFERSSADKRLAGYRQRRDALVDTADSHRELARWCKKNRLSDEARIHWAKVLEFDSQDAEALQGLGLQVQDGMLLTKQQIADRRREVVERAEALRRFKPQMEKLRHALDAGGAQRDAALAELAQLRDPKALAALQAALATDGKSDQDKLVDRTLVKTISQIHSQEATQALVAHAMGASQSELACAELKKRPLATYVPELISSLPVPSSWSASYDVMLLPAGSVLLSTQWHEQRGNQQYTVNRSEFISTFTSIRSVRNPQLNADYFEPQKSLARAAGAVQQFAQQAQRAEQLQTQQDKQDAWQTERVNAVLANITGTTEPKSREDWQSWWADYSETYTPSYDPSLRYGNVAANYFYLNVERSFIQMSCFPAGTIVLTGLGKRPIESLQPGDRVICEDAKTGELVAKPIQATTLRPAVPLVKLTLGSQNLSATRGHPFWVNGQGWTMAKHLKMGQILHGVDGAVRIDAIEEAPAREAYNLVVGDVGTYFVSETPVLVHDNTPITETNTLVPGLELAAAP